MASIVKRKNRYSVVYTYKDDDETNIKNGKPLIQTQTLKKNSN